MKKLLLIACLSFFTLTSFGQSECNPEPMERKAFREGPIELKVRIDSLLIGKNRRIKIDETKVLYVHNQTEIIPFGDTLGIRFFHVQAIENDHVIHLLRFDLFFLSQDGCWKKEHDFNYSELGYYNDSGEGAISVGIAKQSDYFKIKWQTGIDKPGDDE